MSTFQKEMFRDRLRDLRKEKNLRQADAAVLFGVSRTCYSSWELGQSCPPLDDLFKICQFFNVSADYMIGRSNVKDIPSPIPISVSNAVVPRDPFDDLTPDQRAAIETTLKVFRDHNAAKAQEA